MLKDLVRVSQLFSKKDKVNYSGLFVLMAFGAVLEAAGVGAVPGFIATLAVPEKVRSYPYVGEMLTALGIDSASELVIWGAVALLFVFALRSAYLIGLKYLQVRMTEYHRVRIARELFAAYLSAPYEFHLQRNTSELLRNVNTETRQLISGVINPILVVALNVMMTGCIIAVLLYATPFSALLAVGVVGGGGSLFLRLIRSRMEEYGKKARKERKKSIQAVTQGVGALRDARVLGVEQEILEEFHGIIGRVAMYTRFKRFVAKVSNPVLEFMAIAGLVVVVHVLVFAGSGLNEMVPILGLFGAAIVRLRSSVAQITGSASKLQYNMASVDAVVDDLDALREYDSIDHAYDAEGEDPELLSGTIQVSELSYTYPQASEPALDEITMTFERGESYGIVGPTGSGKSTLINVLLALLEPQEGGVFVGGESIVENRRRWLDQVGYVPQDLYLIDDTIRKNIAFGISEANIRDDRIWQVLEDAQLADFVRSLEEGLDTMVGERGVRLSGGQRQRLGLARALYPDPAVLILDEATSALDNETERAVMDAIRRGGTDRTLVMVAHRLATVKNCERLFMLKEGRLVGAGGYHELYELNDQFRSMATLE